MNPCCLPIASRAVIQYSAWEPPTRATVRVAFTSPYTPTLIDPSFQPEITESYDVMGQSFSTTCGLGSGSTRGTGTPSRNARAPGYRRGSRFWVSTVMFCTCRFQLTMPAPATTVRTSRTAVSTVADRRHGVFPARIGDSTYLAVAQAKSSETAMIPAPSTMFALSLYRQVR